ncbi:alginate lyase family protein [Clostridium sp. DL1XJH146]
MFKEIVNKIDVKIIGNGFELAISNDNMAKAEELLLDYYRNREKTTFFFDKKDKHRIVTENKKKYKKEIEEILYKADMALEHKFILRGNSIENPFVFVGDEINWHVTPNGDREGLFSINIQEWFLDLAKAYWYTDDEKYTKGFIELLSDWYEKCPCPNDGKEHFWDYSGWRSLEVSRRMVYFIQAYYMFQDSPYWTPRLNTMFIKLVYEHCNQLAEHICILNHNHTIMHMEGLLYGAIFFPEILESKEWIDIAKTTLEACAEEQIYEDGIHIEAVPAYHNLTVMLFAKPILFAEINGYSLSDSYKERVKKMFQFSMYTYRPDGSCTPIGDSDVIPKISRNYMAAFGYFLFHLNELKAFAEVDEKLSWFVSKINDNKKKTENLELLIGLQEKRAFNNGGYYCIRSNWDDDALYTMFHCGPLVHGHPHADLLSFDIFAYGYSLLTDVGIFTYNECTDRRYLKGTNAHNTITVDGCDQAEYEHRMSFKEVPKYKLNNFKVTNKYSLIDAEHYGYQRLEDQVTHRRKLISINDEFFVVVDTLLGQDEHDIEQFWHFNSNEVELFSKSLIARSNDENKANIQVIPLVTSKVKGEVFESWLSDKYGSKRKAKVARYWIKESLPMDMVTLLIPEEAKKIKKVDVLDYFNDGKHIVINVVIDSKEYTVKISDEIEVIC